MVHFPHNDFVLHQIPVTEDAGKSYLNSLGYDTQEFTDRGTLNVLSLGCSWTQGNHVLGAFPNYTCEELSQHLNVPVKSWNLGLGGRSADYMARTLLCVVDYVKPDAVVLCFPSSDRFEYFPPDDRRIKYQLDWIGEEKGNGGHWQRLDEASRERVRHLNQLSNPYNDSVRFLKDFKLIQEILDIRQIPWVYTMVPAPAVICIIEEFLEAGWIPRANYLGEAFNPIDRVSELDSHPGKNSHIMLGKKIAEWLLTRHLPFFQAAITRNQSSTKG